MMNPLLGRSTCFALYLLCLYCSVSEAAIGLGRDIAVELLHMDTPTDVGISSVFIFLGYLMQYLTLGGLLEYTNPRGFKSPALSEKHRAKREAQVKQEIRLGVSALAITVLLTMVWMAFGEPRTYFYGYFEKREYNWKWFVASVLAYIFWFDTWFYWSHRWLHDIDILWHNVHYIHHQFKEPSAFAQFAVHPVEAALQGPVGHYMASLFFPFHPVALALFGFLGSAWALCAHDGRALDFNSHYNHHCKGRGRFIYFNLGYITPFWDQLCGTRWTETHPMWVDWKKKGGRQVFDTRDGTMDAVSNDKYHAYQD